LTNIPAFEPIREHGVRSELDAAGQKPGRVGTSGINRGVGQRVTRASPALDSDRFDVTVARSRAELVGAGAAERGGKLH
jgi:hypothetical protein